MDTEQIIAELYAWAALPCQYVGAGEEIKLPPTMPALLREAAAELFHLQNMLLRELDGHN